MKIQLRLFTLYCSIVIVVTLLANFSKPLNLKIEENILVHAGGEEDYFAYLPVVFSLKEPVYKIVFASDRTDNFNYDIFIMDADGQHLTNLTNTLDVNEIAPLWSPDGTKIAYYSKTPNDYEIYTMNFDGTGKVNVSNNPTSYDGRVDWAPDSSKLGFISDRRDPEQDYDIFSVDTNGNNLTNLTNSPNSSEQSIDWSPDGTKIVYIADNSLDPNLSSTDIMTMSADGSNKQIIFTSSQENRSATWHPNGLKITFESSVAIILNCVSMIDSNGSNYEPCFTDIHEYLSYHKWNPSGSKMKFTTLLGGNYTVHLFVYDVITKQSRDITPLYANIFAANDWSPDGSQIIGWGTQNSGFTIFVINADGTDFSFITDEVDGSEYHDQWPSWSPVPLP